MGLLVSKEIELNRNWKYSRYRFSNSLIHILLVNKSTARFKIILHKSILSEACRKNGAVCGINGGFFDLKTLLPFMGFKSDNIHLPSQVSLPGVVVDKDGKIEIVKETKELTENYLQTGPLLIWDFEGAHDYSYFQQRKDLFDCYINEKKAPRSAIALDDNYYYLITVDGRSEQSEGIFLEEFTDFLLKLNVKKAINLDGGSSSTLVYKEKILNIPSGDPKKGIPIGSERVVSSSIIGFS